MLISTDCECGNGKNIRKISYNHFALETEGDEAPGYNYYFYLKMVGKSKRKNVELDVYVDQSVGEKKYRKFGTDQPYTLWIKRGKKFWQRFPEKDFFIINDNCYRISLEIVKDEVVYLSNMLPLPYSEMSSWVRVFIEKHKNYAQLYIPGKSSQGREIYALRITDPKIPKKDKARVLIISGQHGIESPGLWAVRGITEYLVSSIFYASYLRGKYVIDIFPQMNPDGNIAGRPQKNATGVNIWCDFAGASEGKLPRSQEGRILWTWAEENSPNVCLNFHGWTCGPACFEGDPPYEGAYVVPLETYKSKRAESMQSVINDYLSWKTGALTYCHSFLNLKKGNLLYQLALKYGTLGCLYEPNMYGGIVGCQKVGVQVLKTVVEAVESLKSDFK